MPVGLYNDFTPGGAPSPCNRVRCRSFDVNFFTEKAGGGEILSHLTNSLLVFAVNSWYFYSLE